MAGAVPLVDWDPSLSPMWQGMPVVEVRNWSLVTPAYLEDAWRRMRNGEIAYQVTTTCLPHWLDI